MSNERVMRLGLTISAKQSQLTISKDVIRILGSPSYVSARWKAAAQGSIESNGRQARNN